MCERALKGNSIEINGIINPFGEQRPELLIWFGVSQCVCYVPCVSPSDTSSSSSSIDRLIALFIVASNWQWQILNKLVKAAGAGKYICYYTDARGGGIGGRRDTQ